MSSRKRKNPGTAGVGSKGDKRVAEEREAGSRGPGGGGEPLEFPEMENEGVGSCWRKALSASREALTVSRPRLFAAAQVSILEAGGVWRGQEGRKELGRRQNPGRAREGSSE